MISKLDELKKRTADLTRGASAKPHSVHTSCNIVARVVATPETRDGALVLQAAPLFDGPYTRAGQPETFVVRPERVKECHDNLNKGAGAGTGSILAFGNAWRDDKSGTISIGWINTCISAQKAKAEMNYHQNRRVEEVFAQMPALDFTNLHRAPGEPERVRWPLGQDFAVSRVQSGGRWQTVKFDRAWLQEKLGQAWEARAQGQVSINLRLPVLRPEQSRVVRNEAEAGAALEALLAGDRYRSVLTRISAGREVAARWQPMMRGENVAEWASQMLSKTPGFNDKGEPVADPETGEQVRIDRFSLIADIDNGALFAAAARGELQIEFVPRDAVLVATKNADGLANDVKAILQSRTADDLRAISFTFGRDPEAISRVALVFQQQDERTYVVAGPFRLDAGPAYSPATVPSPHWQAAVAAVPGAEAAPAAEPEPPLESATVQDIPALGDDDFELGEANIGAALDAGPANGAVAAAPQESPAKGAPDGAPGAPAPAAPVAGANAHRPPVPAM